MWSLKKTHQIGELAAAIAVVVSLVFVGLQIRDNTIATEAATYQDSVAYDMERLLNVGLNPETARVFFTFQTDPDSLNESEFLQGRTLFSVSIRLFENLYLQHEAGMLSDDGWATRHALVDNVVQSPGFERLMNSPIGKNFSGSFIEYAKRIRDESKAGAQN